MGESAFAGAGLLAGAVCFFVGAMYSALFAVWPTPEERADRNLTGQDPGCSVRSTALGQDDAAVSHGERVGPSPQSIVMLEQRPRPRRLRQKDVVAGTVFSFRIPLAPLEDREEDSELEDRAAAALG